MVAKVIGGLATAQGRVGNDAAAVGGDLRPMNREIRRSMRSERAGTRREMTPQFSLRENCDVVPPAGARPESASATVWVSCGSRKLTSEFCGSTSPENC